MSKAVCKGKCPKYKTPKRYIDGAVRCRSCEIFLKWEGIWCPCCGCRVSNKPRTSSMKHRKHPVVLVRI